MLPVKVWMDIMKGDPAGIGHLTEKRLTNLLQRLLLADNMHFMLATCLGV